MTNPIPGAESEHDDTPVSMSTYGSKEACEAEHARRAAAKWNREAIAAGFAASDDAYALYEILGDFRPAGAPAETPKPIGYISKDALVELQDPDAPADTVLVIKHAKSQHRRAEIPVYLAAQPAPIAGDIEKDAVCLDPVVEANRALLHQRSQLGIKKYGGTLDEMRHSHRALMQHSLEEALDLANYLQAEIQALDRAAMLADSSSGEAG